ncbi:hypothetical protein ACIGG9_23260 [Pseudonocardia alni]|uniref:hypothetical protein n=1 Tax=Pseudonocardia alni TaxID=33907 RepID=UPI0006CB7C76|nr:MULTISPECIES: hypothetical protein [Pseudonocardia]ALE78497.1 hypothetical protein WY02_08710 [Pseudonocardia sp. AL041005-10]MBO4238095.1 hypothetical protein [Pseudonocardia alni]NWJ69220.1 hypothetical protein [Pseudonocardia pini]
MARTRIRELVVVHDAACAPCSRIARELPRCVTVRVRARSCHEPRLAEIYPNLPAAVAGCRAPAVGVLRTDGQVRWWTGMRGIVGLAPVLRPGALPVAARLLREAASVRR